MWQFALFDDPHDYSKDIDDDDNRAFEVCRLSGEQNQAGLFYVCNSRISSSRQHSSWIEEAPIPDLDVESLSGKEWQRKMISGDYYTKSIYASKLCNRL